jgi:hypothetical protein
MGPFTRLTLLKAITDAMVVTPTVTFPILEQSVGPARRKVPLIPISFHDPPKGSLFLSG